MPKLYFSAEQLTEESVTFLESYFQKNWRKLSAEQCQFVVVSIIAKRTRNREFATEILKSPLFNLAVVKLETHGLEIIEIPMPTVAITMLKLVESSQKNRTIDDLKHYLTKNPGTYFEGEPDVTEIPELLES